MNTSANRTVWIYNRLHPLFPKPYLELTSKKTHTNEFLGVKPNFLKGKKSLEAGVGGTGWGLQSLYNLGCRDIYAIDLSKENLNQAMANFPKLKRFVKTDQQDATSLKFKNNYFDFVQCDGVIHHTENPSKAVHEIYRVMKPKGVLVAGIYGSGGLIYTLGNLLRIVFRIIPFQLSMRIFTKLFSQSTAALLLDYLYVPIQIHYSTKQAHLLFAKAGFTNIKRLPSWPNVTTSPFDSYLRPSSYTGKNLLQKIVSGTGFLRFICTKPNT